MKVLYFTMSDLPDMTVSGIYVDLIQKMKSEGHDMYVVSAAQRRLKEPTHIYDSDGIHVLRVRTLNVQKTNVVEKGLGQVSIEFLFKRAISKYLRGLEFDLILYATPPITFVSLIKYVKKLNPNAKTYLMLKDIFPQNAIDLNMLSKSGLRGLLFRRFLKQEKELYRISDWIGCMSPANVKYVIEHNPEVDQNKVEICPNSYRVHEENELRADVINAVRLQYGLPINKRIFIYGGNMGKPQGIPFLIECMKAVKDRIDCHFVLVGNGTEYPNLEAWVKEEKPDAVSVYKYIPKAEYDKLANACDVGLIFLDYRFTIPNYPSRLLPYLMTKKPIIAVTDPNCDTGSIAEANGYGLYCPSNSVDKFVKAVDKMLSSDIKQMGENGYQFYLNNYTVQHTYDAIMNHLK